MPVGIIQIFPVQDQVSRNLAFYGTSVGILSILVVCFSVKGIVALQCSVIARLLYFRVHIVLILVLPFMTAKMAKTFCFVLFCYLVSEVFSFCFWVS